MRGKKTEIVSPENYLTRVGRQVDKREWPRRDCKLCVGLSYTQHGMRTIREEKIWLHNISEDGAYASSRVQDPPTHFYIYLGAHQYFIGCTLVGFKNGHMHLRFIREQPTEFVDTLSRITDPFEFRREVRLSLYGLPDREISERPPDRVSGAAAAPINPSHMHRLIKTVRSSK